MNEVKKSLDAVTNFTSEDMEDVKQGVKLGKRRKKRNPLPAAITAFVAAAVLFFAFNVLQDGFSTADEYEYDINELFYDYMIRFETDHYKEAVATDEIRQTALQSILEIDALIDYAKTIGYKEDIEGIDKTIAEQRNAFYAELNKEGEEKKKEILEAQVDKFGMTYDDYFKVFTFSARAEAAKDWLVRHPQEESVTKGEVIGLFQDKYERPIADFMEQKSIPPFDLSVKYEEHEGTVAAIEGDQVLVTHGFVEDAVSKKDKLIVNGAASRFVIDDATEAISLDMDIRVVYDALAYPVTTEGYPVVYEKVKEWERIGSSSEPAYLAKSEGELSDADIETAYEMCVRVLNDYYKAVWNGTAIDLDRFIVNENLKQYIEKKVQLQHEKYGHFNDKVKNIEMNGAWEAELTDDEDGGFLYLHLPVAINKYQGGYGEGTQFLVHNVDGKLVIVDWYTGGKDTYDFMVRGDNVTLDDPEIWNDSEWVKTLGEKTD